MSCGEGDKGAIITDAECKNKQKKAIAYRSKNYCMLICTFNNKENLTMKKNSL